MPVFNYYLVKVPVGKENYFVTQMRKRNDVLYSFFNIPHILTSQVYILDGFIDQDEALLSSHGNAVKRTFSKYGMGKSIHCVNLVQLNKIHSIGEGLGMFFKYNTGNNVIGELLRIAKNAKADDIVLINMSFGPRLNGKSKSRDLIGDVEERYQEEYKIVYAESLKSLAVCLAKMRDKGLSNFIVTKASGNDGYHQLDEVLNGLDEWIVNSLRQNAILVNAFDQKEEVWYTNLPSKKHELCTTIDITEEELRGTSFASPKLLGYIDKVMTEYESLNAQDVLQAIRNATPENPREPMTYEIFEKEAKKLANKQCEFRSYILDMTSNYSGEWNLSDGKAKDIVKYRVYDTYSYEYLSGQNMAIDIENTTNYDLEIFLNAIDTDIDIRSMRYYLKQGESQSFYVYTYETMEIISVNKLEIKIVTW